MAEKKKGADALVSILMPCCGQLEYTRLSVPRVMRYARQPFEVVFIDAGSLDGTTDYLDGVAAGAVVRTEIARAANESEFAALVSQAFQAARGQFVVWLNNDVLVSEMWLHQLVALASANEIIGAVGPMANIAPKQQRVAVPFRLSRPRNEQSQEGIARSVALEAVDRFALEYRQANQGKWAEVESLGGFCWLGKREMLNRVDLLEPGGEKGIFDARRYSDRVRQAGYRLVCCQDMYVHHFGANLLE